MYVTSQRDQWVKVLASKVTILALRGGEEGVGRAERRGLPYKRDRGAHCIFWGFKKHFWYLVIFIAIKNYESESFTYHTVLELVSLGVKKYSSHAPKTGFWYFLGALFKF